MSGHILFNYLANFNITNDEVHIFKCVWQMCFWTYLDIKLTSRKCPEWNLSLKLELNPINCLKMILELNV